MEQKHLQLGLFDERNLLEISSPDYPGERLLACRNPELAKLRAHTRVALLLATEQNLQKIKLRVDAARLVGKDKIGVAVGKCVNQYQVAKHFELVITDNAFTFARKAGPIAAEAAMKKVVSLMLDDGTPVHSWHSLMAELSTIVRNTCRAPNGTDDAPTFEITTTPTANQQRALDLINQIKM